MLIDFPGFFQYPRGSGCVGGYLTKPIRILPQHANTKSSIYLQLEVGLRLGIDDFGNHAGFRARRGVFPSVLGKYIMARREGRPERLLMHVRPSICWFQPTIRSGCGMYPSSGGMWFWLHQWRQNS